MSVRGRCAWPVRVGRGPAWPVPVRRGLAHVVRCGARVDIGCGILEGSRGREICGPPLCQLKRAYNRAYARGQIRTGAPAPPSLRRALASTPYVGHPAARQRGERDVAEPPPAHAARHAIRHHEPLLALLEQRGAHLHRDGLVQVTGEQRAAPLLLGEAQPAMGRTGLRHIGLQPRAHGAAASTTNYAVQGVSSQRLEAREQ